MIHRSHHHTRRRRDTSLRQSLQQRGVPLHAVDDQGGTRPEMLLLLLVVLEMVMLSVMH